MVADPVAADHVRLMFEMYAEPETSFGDITRYFEEHDIKIYGKSMFRTFLSQLLRNPVYAQADLELYGNTFDACRYLDRFFDMRISLPPADKTAFYREMGLESSYVLEKICRKVIDTYNMELREATRFYRQVKTAAYEPTHESRKFDFSFSDEKGRQLLLMYVVPILVGLKIVDISLYNQFVCGKSSKPLMDIYKDSDKGEWLATRLLNRNEAFEVEEGKSVVTVEQKIQQLYDAIFVTEYTGNVYHTILGEYEFDDNSKNFVKSVESMLSVYADYHFHSDSGIGGAYEQAIILKKFIEDKQDAVLYENKNKKFTIQDVATKRILPIVLTLNQFGGLAVNTSLILEKEESQPYPWVCNWHDLENIIEILKYLNKEPEDFIDYIIWRIESHPNVLSSDELNVIEGYFMNSQARKQNGAIFFPANGPSLIDKIYFEKHAIPYEYPVATTVVRKKKKIGRNEPCPCGSGKKFKKCCIEKGIYD